MRGGETCIGRIGRGRTSSGLCKNLAVSFSASSTQCNWRTSGRRVHIPAPLGKKSRPTIASRTLLLPLDCPPTTTIWGRHRHTDGRSWRRVASTLSPASAHASWVGGARGWESGLVFGLGCRGAQLQWGARGETRLESVDEP